MGIVWDLLSALIEVPVQGTVEKSLSSDHRDDPVYKRNLQKLIEHHRQFEKKE
jgi:hypothetical protein